MLLNNENIQRIDVQLETDSGLFAPTISPESVQEVLLLQKASNTFQDVLGSLNKDAGDKLEQEASIQSDFAPLDFN